MNTNILSTAGGSDCPTEKAEKPEVHHHRFLPGGRMGLSAGCGIDGNLSEEMFHLDQPGKEEPADGWRCVAAKVHQ